MKSDFDKKVRNGRKRKGFNRDVETEPSDDDFDNCRMFLDQIRNLNCVALDPLRFVECECLTSLSIDSEQAVEYLVSFAHLSKGIRETIVKEKIRHAEENKGKKGIGMRFYSLPLGTGKKDVCLCVQSFRNVLGIGNRHEWKRLKQSAKSGEPGPIIHANTGNRNRVSFAPYKEAREGLQGFIENLVGHHTEERATRLVRESLTTIERGDSHVVHLASSNTKRKLYEHYCYQRGWVPGRTADGSHGRVHSYEPRENDEEEWPIGSVSLPVCSWWSFRSFWKKEYPNLRIRPQSEDICDECVVFANQFR
jgi:hypothetical protein